MTASLSSLSMTSFRGIDRPVNFGGPLLVYNKTAQKWRMEYVVLEESILKSYSDHTFRKEYFAMHINNSECRKEESMKNSSKAVEFYRFSLTTPFEYLQLATKSSEDLAKWVATISSALIQARPVLQGYMMKRADKLLDKSFRAFFVMRDNTFTMHSDHRQVSHSLFAMPINQAVSLKANGIKLKLTLLHRRTNTTKAPKTITFQFENHRETEFAIWRDTLQLSIDENIQTPKIKNLARVDSYDNNFTGILHVKPAVGDPKLWPEMKAVVSGATLELYKKEEDRVNKTVTEKIIFDPACSVFPTNFRPNSFEIVTTSRILHAYGNSKTETQQWITELKQVIRNCEVISFAQIKEVALSRARNDKIYEVKLEDEKFLGIVFERSADWAVVKVVQNPKLGLKEGSVLMAINSEFIMFDKYPDVVKRLRNWKPPLRLQFRKAPEKSGYLFLKAVRKDKQKETPWKKYYVVMEDGKVKFKENDTNEHEPYKGDVRLKGAAVSLIPAAAIGRFNCFRIISPSIEISFQAESVAELKEWAAALFHGAAIANGGGFILEEERARLNEIKRKRQEAQDLLQEAELEQAMAEEDAAIVSAIATAMEEACIVDLQRALQWAYDVGLGGELVEFAEEQLANLLKEQSDQIVSETQIELAFDEGNAFVEVYIENSDKLLERVEMTAEQLNEDIGDNHSETDLLEQITHDVEIDSTPIWERAFSEDDSDMDIREEEEFGDGHSETASHSNEGSYAITIETNADENIPSKMEQQTTVESDGRKESHEGEGKALEKKQSKYSRRLSKEPQAPAATVEDLQTLFRMHAHADDVNAAYMNPITFSTVWRLITGQKGNLFKEMQMYQRFDRRGDALMTEEDFVIGWTELASKAPNGLILLQRIKFLVGDDNMII